MRQPHAPEQESAVNASNSPVTPPRVDAVAPPANNAAPFAFDDHYFTATPPAAANSSSTLPTAGSKPATADSLVAAAVRPATALSASGKPDLNSVTSPPAVETGTLAVSSPISVEIYMGDKYLGSTPTSLELPAGNQTLEYRHQNLRKQVTHAVKAHETTPAMITFDVNMQINARPWAQIFLEGTPRRALGQTPLSDVQVPIGGTLIFKNPNFPEKTYRVTGTDTAIQIAFP